MTKEEIYEHLAKVYLGKKKKKKTQSPYFRVLLIANAVALGVIVLIGAIKLSQSASKPVLGSGNMLSLRLDNYPLRLKYDFQEKHPQIQNFSMYVPNLDLRVYKSFTFSIRGFSGKIPRMVKIALENKKKEKAEFYYSDISARWKKVSIPLSEFKAITDWSNITRIAFIFEAWNLNEKEGKVLIDDVAFLSTQQTVIK